MKTLYEDDAATISWNERDKIIELAWKGFAWDDTYRNPLDALLEFIKTKKATKLLTDMRDMKAVSKDDQTWTETDFAPRLMASGIKFMVMVHPSSAVGRLSLKDMRKTVEQVELPYELLNTFDIQEGRNWLKSC